MNCLLIITLITRKRQKTMKWTRNGYTTAIIVMGVLISALFLGLVVVGLWKLLF
jgi:hypothetical protein